MEALARLRVGLGLPRFVGRGVVFLPGRDGIVKLPWFGAGHVEIGDQVVGALESDAALDLDARLINNGAVSGDVIAIDH